MAAMNLSRISERMKIIHYAILLLFFASFMAAAAEEQEADRWYQVEIIIFSHRDDAVKDDEQFPVDPGQPAVDKAIELAPAPLVLLSMADVQQKEGTAPGVGETLVMPYQMLVATEFRLKNMAVRLARSKRYVPLLHLAWRQPAFSRKQAAPVHIHWRPVLAPVVQQVAADEALTVPPDSSSRIAKETLQPAEHEGGDEEAQSAYLDGLVTVSANRYLHLDFDLLYGMPPPADKETHLFSLFGTNGEEKEARVFRMVQSRRLRRGEYHYFDHPRFGLIALVTPYSYPVRTEDVVTDDNSGAPAELNP